MITSRGEIRFTPQVPNSESSEFFADYADVTKPRFVCLFEQVYGGDFAISIDIESNVDLETGTLCLDFSGNLVFGIA